MATWFVKESYFSLEQDMYKMLIKYWNSVLDHFHVFITKPMISHKITGYHATLDNACICHINEASTKQCIWHMIASYYSY